MKVKINVTITKYRFKLLNFGFLGVLIFGMFVSILYYIRRWWISILIIMVAWWICEYLIEKEVNNWLLNEAFVEIK